MKEQKYFIGVDVSKNTLDFTLVISGKVQKHTQIGNTEKAIKAMLKKWEKEYEIEWENCLLCMEHTGIYCYRLLNCVENSSMEVCLESSYTIQRSQGLQRGKNDKIDSERIAMYAWKHREKLRRYQVPKRVLFDLKHLVGQRRVLIKARKQIYNYVKETGEFVPRDLKKQLNKNCSKSLKALTTEIKALEKSILNLIQSDSEIKHLYDIVTSVDGIGQVTAALLLVTTNGFTRITEGKKYACYAGVVPFENSSGTSVRGKTRVSYMANKEVKTALHLAALSATRSKGDLGIYFRRKVLSGKNKMSVLNAIRNKIVLRVFACVRDNRLYEKTYEKVAA
jgi:transposase